MANSPQARKRIRSTVRKTQVNMLRRSRLRTYLRKVEAALEAGDGAAAKTALSDVQPELARAAEKGILHKNTASRKFSRLNARVKALA